MCGETSGRKCLRRRGREWPATRHALPCTKNKNAYPHAVRLRGSPLWGHCCAAGGEVQFTYFTFLFFIYNYNGGADGRRAGCARVRLRACLPARWAIAPLASRSQGTRAAENTVSCCINTVHAAYVITPLLPERSPRNTCQVPAGARPGTRRASAAAPWNLRDNVCEALVWRSSFKHV